MKLWLFFNIFISLTIPYATYAEDPIWLLPQDWTTLNSTHSESLVALKAHPKYSSLTANLIKEPFGRIYRKAERRNKLESDYKKVGLIPNSIEIRLNRADIFSASLNFTSQNTEMLSYVFAIEANQALYFATIIGPRDTMFKADVLKVIEAIEARGANYELDDKEQVKDTSYLISFIMIAMTLLLLGFALLRLLNKAKFSRAQ